jgi:septum formation protein
MSLKQMELILASGSSARKTMLENAGLEFEVLPAQIDEHDLMQKMLSQQETPEKITLGLAIEKCLDVSKKKPDCLVIGSDQTLVLEDIILSKAKSKSDAIDKLRALRSKKHTLNSAVCVANNGKIIWSFIDHADLTMKNFDDNFLNDYAEYSGDILTQCVGAYAIEGTGSWLFDDIRGDYFTIMGMPLLPLLSFLQTKGFGP